MSRLACVAACALSLIVASGGGAEEPKNAAPSSEKSVLDEIADCMAKNRPMESSIQTIAMNSHDRIGSVNETRARIYWRTFDDKSRILLYLTAPPDMRGASLLMLEKDHGNDMFMFLPELNRTRRVTSRMAASSMFGTDFAYEDFERLQGLMDDATSRRLDDTEIDGVAVYTIENIPRQDPDVPSSYEKVITFVEKERCVPLRVDFIERGGKLRKQLLVDRTQINQHGAKYIPQRLVMTDHRDQTRTELLVEEIELDAEIKSSLFTARALETGAARR